MAALPAGAFGITKDYRARWGEDAFRSLASVAFKEADVDGSGLIDLSELRATLAKVRVILSEEECTAARPHGVKRG